MNLRSVLASLRSDRSLNTAKVTLFQGQVFLGKVLKLFPKDHALVQLGGLQVHAKLEAPLAAGRSYWLEVANSQGTPQLKVLESGEIPRQGERSGVALLETLGLSPSKTRVSIVKVLMDENIPFSKEMIVKGAEWLKSAENKEAGLSAIKDMGTKKLPFSRVIFEALLAAQDGTPVHERLGRLTAALGKTNENTDSVDKLRKLLPELIVNPNASGNEMKTSLQQVIARLGLSFERDLIHPKPPLQQQETLKRLLTQMIQQAPSQEIKQQAQQLLAQLSTQKLNAATDLQKLMQPLLLQAFERIDLSSDKNLLNLSSPNASQPLTLKPLLLQVLQQTQSSDVRQQIQQMLSHITSQQLSGTGPFQSVIQLPYQIGGHTSDLTIKWEGKKDKQGRFDADFCRILFYLDLAHLHETAVDVNIQKRFVTIYIFNENHNLGDLIKRFEPQLKERLEAGGYYLSSIQQQEGKLQEIGRADAAGPTSEVDFRV